MKIQVRPTKKQWQVYEALKIKDDVFFGGGAGGGKSWVICESRIINAYKYAGYKSFIGREELKRLMASTYITFQKVCKYHGIPQSDWKLNGQYNYIEFKNGSRIDLLDLKFLPSDPLYERFGSLEYSDGAIEEAGEVHFLAYDVLRTRINRHLNKELGIRATMLSTGNPKKNWTYTIFYKPWKKNELPENTAFIQSLYSDNPYTSQDYKKNLEGIRDKETKERLMFGNWEYDDDPSALIQYDNIIDMFTNTVDEEGIYLTCDVARFGVDKTVIYVWKGLKVIRHIVMDKSAIPRVAGRIKDLAVEYKIPYSHVVIDEDGVGGGVVDILEGVNGFVNNSVALKNRKTAIKENFRNLKTQCYYKLAEMINSHQIAFRTEDTKLRELLIEELEQVKRKDSEKEGTLQIISKEEIKEKIGRSPDFADALMMRMYIILEQIKHEEREVVIIHHTPQSEYEGGDDDYNNNVKVEDIFDKKLGAM